MKNKFPALLQLQKSLKEKELYFINKNNSDLTENVSLNDNDLYALIRFKGSSGKLTLSRKQCILWVDGRYLEASREEYSKSLIQVYSSTGPEGWEAWVKNQLKSNESPSIFLDTSKWSSLDIQNLLELNPKVRIKNYSFQSKSKARKARHLQRISTETCGEDPSEKLKRLQSKIKKGEIHLLRNQEDLAWLLNLRAWDFPYSRIIKGKALVGRKTAVFFSDLLPGEMEALQSHLPLWTILPRENTWFDALKRLRTEHPRMVFITEYHNRPGMWNYSESLNLEKLGKPFPKKVERSIVELMRMRKNNIEIRDLESSSLKLAQVMETSIQFLHREIDQGRSLTERSLGQKIDRIARQLGAKGNSFPVITGSGPNGARPHHQWQRGKIIQPGEMVVLDIGYYFGEAAHATDMTRTLLAGTKSRPTSIQKKVYTQVLKAFLRQLFIRFHSGELTAKKLDSLGRSLLHTTPNYKFIHSTGHGLGIQDHELAISISPSSDLKLRKGYCYSIEPGLYYTHSQPPLKKRNHFGVRLEDIVVVEKRGNHFTHHVLGPCSLDHRLIDLNEMGEADKRNLYQYEQLLKTRDLAHDLKLS